MNVPINEDDLARKIVRQLDQGVTHLDNRLQDRLQMARQHALEAYIHPPRSVNLVWSGHGERSHHGGAYKHFRTWVSLAILLLSLITIGYWQTVQGLDDASDTDEPLLAHDLPIDAFIDTGVDTWLEGSSVE